MKVIVIGAVAAGSKAAAKLKRLKPEWDVVIYTSDKNVAYSECGLPYYIGGAFADINNLVVRTPKAFENSGIKVYLRHEVIKIFTENKEILVRELDNNNEFVTKYDKLIIATGARAFIPEKYSTNLQNVFKLRDLDDGYLIKKAALQSKKAVILGGGYIGIEMLEAFVKQHLQVILIHSRENIMSIFDPDISSLIQKHVIQRDLENIRIIDNDTIEEIQGDSVVKRVITKNDINIDTDLVLLSIGVKPNVELASSAGILLGKTGAIKVNEYMETNIDDIYACGDCVEKYNIVADAPCWIPLGSTANKEGRCCAMNVAGIKESFTGILGSSVSKYFNFTMSMTGLTETDAKKYGFEPVSVIVKKNDKAGYMPNVKRITLKLVADKTTNRILGAQGIGTGDVDKRINTLTSALLSKMTLQEFVGDDITYAPPFSTSIDLMLNAAQKLIHKLSMH